MSFPMCYRLNVHIPPKFICWNAIPQCEDIWRQSLWEVIRSWGWSPHDGNNILLWKYWEEIPLLSPPSPPCKGYNKKMAICKLRRELSPETGPAAPWSWIFQLLELWKIIVCCLSHSIYGIFHFSSLKWLGHRKVPFVWMLIPSLPHPFLYTFKAQFISSSHCFSCPLLTAQKLFSLYFLLLATL